MTDWHRVLQEVDAKPVGGQPTVTTDRHRLPGVRWSREADQAWASVPARALQNGCTIPALWPGVWAVPLERGLRRLLPTAPTATACVPRPAHGPRSHLLLLYC